MKYVAFLRGINVGGNNIIKMLALKESFEKNGFDNVKTYIQSGNVLFESKETDHKKLTQKIEAMLSKTFNYKARVIIESHEQLKQVIAHAPKEWNTRTDIRCYIGFLSDLVSVEDALKEVEVKEEVDSLQTTPGVLYMTSLLNQLTKSKFNRLASKPIYKEMTIRNYTTTRKLLALMEDE